MTPNERFDQDVKRDVQARVREGVKAILEEVLEEEMTAHLEAGYHELTPPLAKHQFNNLRLPTQRGREAEFRCALRLGRI